MIDSIRISVTTSVYTEEKLSHLHKSIDEDGVIRYTGGRLKNLTVIIRPTDSHLYQVLISGSIRKYFFGECAADDLDYMQYLQAIDQIRTALGISEYDMNVARLLRIDCGLTLQVEKNVSTYLNAIISRSRLPKDTYENETVQFQAANKKIIFYDKFKELRKNGLCKEITLGGKPLLSRNLLRFEVQWAKTSGLLKQLGNLQYLGQVHTKMTKLIDRFISEFKKVHFSLTDQLQLSRQITVTSDILATAFIWSANSDTAAIEILTMFRNQGIITRDKFTAARRKITANAGNLATQ